MTTSSPHPPSPNALTARPDARAGRQRLDCNVCMHRIDPGDGTGLVTFPCHVQAFLGETFNVWRCPKCRTIHCLEIVDLDHYYAKYPFADMTLTWPFRIFYRNLARRLTRHGFTKEHSLLDYGCGNGLFVRSLQARGFTRCHGYDPYGKPDGTGDRARLQEGPFDYILLQDVLEHTDGPEALLEELDGHLRDGGFILIGTPNAANIDLSRPSSFMNEVHVPYHLHIYTRDVVEAMGKRREWVPVGFFDRSYHDRPWFGLNSRAAKQYQRLVGGTMDAVLSPVKPWKALASPRFVFLATCGYWFSHKSDMTVVFRKPR